MAWLVLFEDTYMNIAQGIAGGSSYVLVSVFGLPFLLVSTESPQANHFWIEMKSQKRRRELRVLPFQNLARGYEGKLTRVPKR